ncbi:UV-stimulated scaffold protein A [Cryptotermes secundus]|nr:UV-stimulated scaffold protein A [Cryptotermes secundus]PNF21517.1 UV-stimulated scaffold protein A [Cryptotermes secundus]
MQHVMELTCETSSDRLLPPPRSVALSLKRMALQCIQEWNKEYGDGYKKLQLGYNFLKHCKKVDFNALQIENSAEQVRQQEQERRQNLINQEKLKKIMIEINEMQPEITNTLTALENCICLLFPTPEDFFIQDGNETETKSKISDEKPSPSNCSGTKQTEDQNKNEEQDLDQKDRLSELIESARKVEEKKNIVKNDSDVPSISRSKDDDDMEEDNSEFGSETSDSEEDIDFREYGILNSKYSIEVNVNTDSTSIKETADNDAIFENAKDMYTLINNRYLPTVKKWIQVITKASGSSDQLKKILDLKNSLEKATKKYTELKCHTVPNDANGSSDSDFEEVEEKDGYEKMAQEDVPLSGLSAGTVFGLKKFNTKTENQSSWNIWSEDNSEMDPTSARSTLSVLKSVNSAMPKSPKKENMDHTAASCSKHENTPTRGCSENEKVNEEEPVPSTSKDNSVYISKESQRAKLLAAAPKVPFDIDLYHWEDDKIQAPTMVAVRAEGSRFWYTSLEELEEVPVPDGIPSLRTRVIEFTGKFEPVRWACRAPLPSGKLCPRRDRYKCPFHGPIVSRDETGKCTKPDDAQRLAKEEEKKTKECPDWQDPQLLEDIKHATGVDLRMPEKKKRKGSKKKKQSKQSKCPGLTDISAKQNTAYTRLSKKIFKRGAMKRVARSMDAADHKRFRDKYGDQFHYMYNTV